MKKAEEIAQKMRDSAFPADKASLAELLSELIYLAFILSEQFGVNLEEDFLQTIDGIILGSVS